MNGKRMIIIVSSLLILGSLFFGFGIGEARMKASHSAHQIDQLQVKLKTSKEAYVQGEIVPLSIEVANTSSSDVFLKGADAESGYVKIYVADNNSKFSQYRHSDWGRGKTKGLTIKAGQTIDSHATLLWNFKPKVSHLNENAARIASEGLILTDYAFDKPGTYFIKAVLIIPGETQTRVESQPIQIVIEAPTGEDLKVWDRIKDNGEIAYFIQEGAARSAKPEEKEPIVKQVEQLVADHPNSFLTSQIKQSLDKFRASEARRKEWLEKRNQKTEN